MEQDRKSLVYRGSPPDSTAVDQALRILPSGEWVVLFMTGGTGEPRRENFIALCRSSDRGVSWSAAETVLRYDDQACLLSEAFLDNDTLTVYVSTHDGRFGDWRVSTITSSDGGRTWTEPVPFAPLPVRTFPRNVYVTSWGEWVMPYQTYDTVADPVVSPLADGSHTRGMNGALVSSEHGRTWTDSNRIGPTAGWAENNVVELSDGRLVMLVRADGTGRLFRSESADHGRTWADLVPTDIPNPGSKVRLWRLDDGRIVLVHNPNSATSHPNTKPHAACHRNPLAIWISDDDMETWGYKRVLTDFPGMLAYPDGVVDPGGGWVHFVFDYNRHDVIYWGARLP